jgi:hypothetical protein
MKDQPRILNDYVRGVKTRKMKNHRFTGRIIQASESRSISPPSPRDVISQLTPMASPLLRRTGFDSGPVHAIFLVGNTVLAEVLLRVLRFPRQHHSNNAAYSSSS